jgi:succinate dehydrogenase flavin-adding protein (antitoxin of CptAB toxin-antitoxin module)
MRELDALLMRYVDRHFAAAAPDEQRAFETLISMSDPEILSLLTGRARSDDEQLSLVVERVLAERLP